MKRTAVIGMVLVLFVAAGCIDNREQSTLKEKVARLSDQVAFLEARIKAVEEACLQLNSRISTAAASTQQQAADQEATVKSDTSRQEKDKGDLLSLSPNLHARPTRLTFSRRMVGMTLTEALATVGKPDKTSEVSGAKHWTYNALLLGMEKGGVEQSPALIVLENDSVTRAVLMDNVEYSSEPPKDVSAGAAVQTNQAAPAAQ